jgi:hypothetical protein
LFELEPTALVHIPVPRMRLRASPICVDNGARRVGKPRGHDCVGSIMSSLMTRSVEWLGIDQLNADPELQMRAQLNEVVVLEYAELYDAGRPLPPVLVFVANTSYWLVDGYHRVAARKRCGETRILAELRPGTRDDALWAACGANQAHGLRRTNSDKQRAVQQALLHPRGRKLSDRQLAQHCGVHHFTVGRERRCMEATGTIRQMDVRVVDSPCIASMSRKLPVRTPSASDPGASSRGGARTRNPHVLRRQPKSHLFCKLSTTSLRTLHAIAAQWSMSNTRAQQRHVEL